ncbi:MAG: PrgI family protein [Clostridia bacterium]|nr:PrgI family protein [Clostridia bacterium]
MRIFKIPYDIKREEKIFGGYLSLRQVLYLMLIGITCSIFLLPIPKILSISIISILVIFLLLCAFLKINEQNFDKFFFYALKYLFRRKKYVFRRENEEC